VYIPTTVTEHFKLYGINVGVNYQLTKKINTGLSYTHWTRGSNIAANEYGDDQVTLQMRYNF
jgi:hypothetical protein